MPINLDVFETPIFAYQYHIKWKDRRVDTIGRSHLASGCKGFRHLKKAELFLCF